MKKSSHIKVNVLIDEFLDKYFSQEWSQYRSGKDISREKSKEIIQMEWKLGRENCFPNTEYGISLTKEWYNSLSQEVYNDKYFFTLLYFCWLKYSRKYINDIYRNPFFSVLGKQVDNVFDIGNGLGYSTLQLCDIFPENTKIFATNIRNTDQWNFNNYLIKSSGKKSYTLFEDFNEILFEKEEEKYFKSSKNLIFASEFFEHLYEPIDYLEKIINILSPKYLIIANSFNTHSVGHYNEYKVNGVIVKSNVMTKIFNDRLKSLGYTQVKIGLWNNRPNIWER